MTMNTDHFHTHDNFKIAGKIIDQVSALKQRNAELEKENAELKEERRWRKYPEEKPEHNGIFIVLIREHTITLDAYNTNKGKFQTYRPTAWMPLPKAPEGK